MARPLAVAAVVALIAVGVWGLSLSSQLNEQQQALNDVATAISNGQTAHRVEGEAGRGYLVDTPGSGAQFVVTDVSELDPDQLYELWLIGPDGPVAAGTFEPTDAAVAGTGGGRPGRLPDVCGDGRDGAGGGAHRRPGHGRQPGGLIRDMNAGEAGASPALCLLDPPGLSSLAA